MTTQAVTAAKTSFTSAEKMLESWLGHRRLTRKVIEAFPEDKLFTYSIGGMRPFGIMVKELLDIGGPGIKGIIADKWDAAGNWDHSIPQDKQTKQYLLERWDEETAIISELWPQISEERFQDRILAFGMYEGEAFSSILYYIDNEIHHRAQGYVYLRSLGIEPPAFWDRN